MYESMTTVGERGQITIPKDIRKKEGIKPKDKVIVKIEDNKIVVEKSMSRKEKEKLLKEYYVKYGKEDEKLAEEWRQVSKEADAVLDDY
ncbi:MAG: AbrB/MazE/SpoVT family DNA-binding domain-containing protein [archaeon]